MRFRLASIGILLLLANPVAAAGALPDTPAGRRAGEVLEQLNASDAERARRYIEEQFAPEFRDAFPMPMHLGFLTQTRAMFGELEVFEVVEATDSEVRLLLKSIAREAYLRLDISVESTSPFRITVMGIGPAEPPAGDGAADGRDPEPGPSGAPVDWRSVDWDAVDRMLERRAAAGEFSGAVLIARNGEPLFQQAYGPASKELGVANRIDTRFNLGSLNKLFTSVAVIQLLQEGRLSVDAPIGTYLGGFPPEVADRVTVRHLLQMRAGWGDYWNDPAYLERRNELREVADYLAFIRTLPLEFEPGSRQQHCNTCFELLGAIVEAVSGMNYYAYIDERIYRTAGMAASGSFHRDRVTPDVATGYTNLHPNDDGAGGFRWTNQFLLAPRGTPAGGGYSTVGDFLKFDQALRRFRLLDQDHTEFLWSQFDGSPGDGFTPRGMARAMGGAPGIGALYGYDLVEGVTLLIFTNFDAVALEDAFRELLAIVGLE